MTRFRHILVLSLMMLLAVALFAQESAVKGNLGGIVVDSTGALVQNAKVTLQGPTGTKSASTDSLGRFAFDLLTPGIYALSAEMTGFKTVEVKGVEVYTNKTSSVRLTLEPGTAKETIEVSGAAITVDTTSSAIGENLNDAFYSRIPMGRNVTSLFYASPGVTSGGGTGAANPSISGGSGLENEYVADGVNITDGAFGGIGVFSRVYGPLATGINLSFVKEVQVKTAGYEPQYGKSTGGLVQIVTKSGSNEYHGAVAGYFGPQQFEAERLNADNFSRLNQYGLLSHQEGYDVSGEIGGYVPGMKDRMFFFGSFNPSWNTQFSQLANMHGVFSYPLVGKPMDLKQTSYNYAGKLTLKLSDRHSVETSIYGDPTRSNTSAFNNTDTFSDTTFSKLSNGTRNWVARYNASLSPTWLLNASFSWGHNYLTEDPLHRDAYQIDDYTGCGFTGTTGSASCVTPLTPGTLNGPLGPMTGIYRRQGVGYTETTEGDNYSANFDTQKVVDKLGSHTFSLGYHYDRNFYKGSRFRTGPLFTVTPTMAAGMGVPAAAGLLADAASFQLRITSSSGICGSGLVNCPTMFVPGVGPKHVYLRQTRGEFGKTPFDTDGNYHAAYLNDAWSINRYITVNVGWRWEQQRMQGTPYTDFVTGQKFHTHFVYTDNWSPRIGLAIDPMGDRKTKVYGNFARYSYAIPLDMAIRSLSNELDFSTTAWAPVSSGGNVVINPDGTLANPILDDAHYLGALGQASLSSTESIAPGTKMQYLQEWVGGVEHEFPKGIVANVRWVDRRIKRIVEDMAGISPEAFQCCLNQNYLIANPSFKTDLFVNPVQVDFPANALPVNAKGVVIPSALCPTGVGGTATDFAGNSVGDFCISNPATAGTIGADGKPDGFVNPVRIYKAVEFEVNKAFTRGWQMRTNYRWSELLGNYEGAFRNDNGQSDPSISSLFDFVQGDFGLLGNQFDVGSLNTDRRHIMNAFLSYSFTGGFLRNLTLGTGVRVESGIPINDLRAHPAYQNAGEIPVGGRGHLGRTPTDGQADAHADYALKLTEKHRLHFGADLFNITNQRTQLRVDEWEDRSFLVKNADFLKPRQTSGLSIQPGFQRPFYARLFVKWEF
jgi:Carboxypeptidase regulatory-like domain/TonB-dependent Receptor Plug Domain